MTVPDDADVVFSLDAGPEMRHATIGVGWRRPDGRIHVEAVEGFEAAPRPSSSPPPTGSSSSSRIGHRGRLLWSPGPPADAAVTRILDGLDTAVVRLSKTDLASAITAFYEAAVARVIVHPVDALTAAHVAAVTSDGVLTRRSPTADIDAAVALVLARHGAVNAPRPGGSGLDRLLMNFLRTSNTSGAEAFSPT